MARKGCDQSEVALQVSVRVWPGGVDSVWLLEKVANNGDNTPTFQWYEQLRDG